MVGQKVIAKEEVSISIVTIVKIHAMEWNKFLQDLLNGVIDIFQHAPVRKILHIKLKELQNGEVF